MPRPYVLSVGTLEPRKNQARLVRAYRRLAAEGRPHALVLNGPDGWLDDELRQELAAEGPGRVVRTRDLGAHDLDALYRGADVFAYPSLYEGFGLPVVEALARGVPTVAADASSIPEVAGDAALLVDPLDEEAIADALARVLDDPALAEDLRRRGRERAAAFSWPETARATLRVYRHVVGAPDDDAGRAFRDPMKVTLISTVKDCADSAGAFLASLAAQTRAPDEVVIVDGGSSRRHGRRLRSRRRRDVLVEPGANISRGRNVALAAATHDVIAATDADCELDPGWLEAIVAPIEAGADVSMGWYEPVLETSFERCMAAVNLPLDAGEVDPATFNPSARSVAFRREAIDAVGGYPEWLAIGEDMWVDQRWRELGMDMRFAPDAIVRWRLREGLGSDLAPVLPVRAAAMRRPACIPERHALRFGVYAGTRRRARVGIAPGRGCSRRRRGRLRTNAGAPRMGASSRHPANARSPRWRCRP